MSEGYDPKHGVTVKVDEYTKPLSSWWRKFEADILAPPKPASKQRSKK